MVSFNNSILIIYVGNHDSNMSVVCTQPCVTAGDTRTIPCGAICMSAQAFSLSQSHCRCCGFLLGVARSRCRCGGIGSRPQGQTCYTTFIYTERFRDVCFVAAGAIPTVTRTAKRQTLCTSAIARHRSFIMVRYPPAAQTQGTW